MPGCYFLGVITERLYFTDSYLAEFEAQIVDVSADGQRVYLNKTVFYPTSGGQPHDVGALAGVPVLDVIDEDGAIAHVLGGPAAPSGSVRGHIDWDRRYDHMQQHTGQHLLSAVFTELFGFETLSFHMGSEVSTIELGTRELSEGQIHGAEDRANQLVRARLPVQITFEEAATVQGLRKLTERSGTLRIIEIQGADRSACGGTHVHSTAECGPILLRRLEKVRSNVRIEFVCGIRAIRRARADYRILAELAKSFATPVDKLPEHLCAVQARLSEAEKDRGKLRAEVAAIEGARLFVSTPPGSDAVRRVFLKQLSLDESARAKALAFTSAGSPAIALLAGTEPSGVLLACSPDSGVNAGTLLKKFLALVGGRGGGTATLAQGSLPATALESLARELGFPGEL